MAMGFGYYKRCKHEKFKITKQISEKSNYGVEYYQLRECLDCKKEFGVKLTQFQTIEVNVDWVKAFQ